MKRLSCFALIAVAAVATAQTVDPAENYGSLFPKGSRSLIESRTAMRKGDVITIVVLEQIQGQIQSNTVATKRDETAVGRSDLPILGDVLKWLRIPSLGVLGNKRSSADSTVSGTGITLQQNRLTARLAAVVVEVQPNGNLVIEGKKEILLNKETVTITVSGIVRRDDVRLDNSVLSENVADAQIRATGRGTIADRQRRGILTRILDWLF